MSQPKLRFAIFGNVYQPKKSASICDMLSCLSKYGAEVSIDGEFYRFLVDTLHLNIKVDRVFEGNDFDADFVISMGGDGTFLKSAARVGEKNIPIVGVNIGRLGFLADVVPSEIDYCLSSLYAGDYKIYDREVIEVSVENENQAFRRYALNDVAVLKRDNASMISIHVSVNGDYLITYQADGVIMSTPTGSTAYSLSNGGPIIVPGTNVFALTAVAPHSLNVRPIVLSDKDEVTLQVESRNHNFLLAVDGSSERVTDGSRVTLRRAPYNIHVVKRFSENYFNTLRKKMMWGADPRE